MPELGGAKRNALVTLALVLLFARTSQGAVLTYAGTLTGAAESPANASPGTGTTTITYDSTAHTLTVVANFSGLTGTTSAAHIHCCTAVAGVSTAGVATQTPTFTGFPSGVTSGAYSSPVFDLTLAPSWNPAYVTANGGTTAGAEAALASGLAAGKAYLNIHTSVFPGGEIRSFLIPASPVSLMHFTAE